MKIRDANDGIVKNYSETEAAEQIQELRERNKELHLLHELTLLGSDLNLSPEEFLQKVVSIIPAAWQYPENTCARIRVGETEVMTENFRNTEWKLSALFEIDGEENGGVVEVCYLNEKPERDDGPFLSEERRLIDSIARQTAHIIEHRRMFSLLECRNQNLEASNQQLRATEQQLRASNQQLRASEQREQHLNKVLRSIRNVNQLIVSEKDPALLIKETCRQLIKTRGYLNGWIALLGGETGRSLGLREKGCVSEVASAGFDQDFSAMQEKLERGQFPACMSNGLNTGDTIVVEDPVSDCAECPLSHEYTGRSGLARRLDFDGVTYGILAASLPGDYALNAEEQELFSEIAGDLAFALSKIASDRSVEETRRRYKEIFECSRDGFVMKLQTGRIIDANDAYCRMLGYTLDELRALPDFDAITPERWREWEAEEICGKRLLVQDDSGLYEKEYIRKDGTVFPVEIRAFVVRDENGGIDYIWKTVRDITERKHAEEALKQRLLYETAIADITTLGVNTKSIDLFMKQCFAILGKITEVSRVYVFEYDHDKNTMNNTHEWCAEGVKPQIDELQDLPGEFFAWWLETLRKGEVICYSDIEEIPDEAARDILRPQGVRSILVVPLFVRSDFFGFIGFDECDEYITWSAEDIAILTTISRILTAVIDRKQGEEMIKSERDRLKAVMDTVPVAILLADADQRIVQVNRGAELLFGSTDFLCKKPLSCGEVISCVHRNDSPDGCGHGEACASCDLYSAIKEGLAGKKVDSLETEIRLESEKKTIRRRVFLSIAPFPFVDQPGVIVAAKDITEIRELHAKIAQADRLSSMGMLAAGVAHEIKNPLSYSLYNMESLTQELPALASGLIKVHSLINKPDTLTQEETESLAELITPVKLDDILSRFRDALSGMKRIHDISRSLGTFSRVERDTFIHVNLVDVIETAINMAYNEIKYRARLVKEYKKVPMVSASEGRLSQVFLNLIINATHAIEEGDVENNEIRVRTWSDENYVYAEVKDTGSGIDRKSREKLFEPFYSTKDIGKGSGLGLTISKSIIESYGGAISVDSEKGKGTSFIVQLPVAEKQVEIARTPQPSQTDEHVEHVKGRILIVDDEARIRSSMKRMLRKHETVEAESGAEAIRLLKEDREFDLILCDMMMPNMSGMDLHKWLVENFPELAKQLIFITGGAFTPRARDYLSSVDNLRLEKPFCMESFINAVNERVRKIKSLNPGK